MAPLKVLHLATVGEDASPVLVQVRDYPVAKLILLTHSGHEAVAERLRRTIEPLNIPVEVRVFDARDLLMSTLAAVAEIVAEEAMGYDDIILNVSSGDKMLTCSALSAAFVNGVRAIGVMDDVPFQMPVLKFSYTELVSEPKRKILDALDRAGGEVDSLNRLSELASVEKSLLSYHVRGSRDSKGLEPLGLVEVDRAHQGRLVIRITEMGRLMLIGRVLRDPAPTKPPKAQVPAT
ncbi:MAG TPA: DUF6293 family protein [Candidatus Thermoplasmatota archaeon]